MRVDVFSLMKQHLLRLTLHQLRMLKPNPLSLLRRLPRLVMTRRTLMRPRTSGSVRRPRESGTSSTTITMLMRKADTRRPEAGSRT